ncbi:MULTISPECIES: hypothetical protein [unclassified Amycolatopsis]|uniref:hypothetical protein n=1 Tax=unclassified Amycolatopsis TaxID=2618356 RepID=UPI001FF31FBC|nr:MULTISPECIES: hypothetical protein [unclassified Amycolatopsis]UOZ08707.1 hypothetical protein MUY22_10705 [Amycolatopsis sp. WQ 127309]WSJ74968.1 hypothetical protein OG439_36885 [Amycolatopsis sp. NBC_01307]WSK81360.1 hypothetical protein OG570_12680 [Amycolatopsis sp. NBC_01286]
MSGPSYDLSTAVPVAPAAADVLVHPDKVLDVARIVEEQANALEDQLLTRLGELRIDAPSADVISTQSMAAWNSVIADGDRSYAGQVREYVAGLKRLVSQLRDAAKDYQVSEDEKAAVFGDRGKHGA